MDPIKYTATTSTPPTADAVKSLLEAGAGLAKAQPNPSPHGNPYVMIPPGWDVHDLETPYQPRRPVANAHLGDVTSFCAYWSLHRQSASRIYATLTPPKFISVLDDFVPTGGDDADCHAPWREFRARFEPAYSAEWTAWKTRNKNPMSQLQFAEFLQDNLPDVAEPDGATLLEMALNFESSQTGSFVASQRLQDGSHNLQWKADNNASGTVQLPQMLTLRVPVFDADEPMPISARLRYRVTDGKLALWYELVRPHKAEEAALREMWQRIEAAAGTRILLGRPE